MDQNITRIYTANPLTVSSTTSIHDCIALMRKNSISCLVVSDDNRPVGIYTEADMVRSLNKGVDYQNTTIGTLMSFPLITATDEINVFEATYILTSKQIRHLVITDKEGFLAGIVTQTDVIAHYGEDYFLGAKSVNHVMTQKILTVDKSQIVHQVVDQMAHYLTGCAIAVDNGVPIGILTERDMATLIINEADIDSLTMEEVMTSPVLSLPVSTSTYEAVEIMNRHKVRRIIVVDEQNKVAGILIQENIIRNLESNYVEFLKEILWERESNLASTKRKYQAKSVQFESLMNTSLDMSVMVLDQDFKIVYLNYDGQVMFEVENKTVKGLSVDQVIQCDSVREQTLENIRQEISDQGEYWFMHLRHQDQCMHHIESRITPIFEENNLTGYTLASRDITDKLHTEKRILLASHVFECTNEGIMVTDTHGAIQLVNPAFSAITGYSAEDVIGKNPRILQSKRQEPEFYTEMWNSIIETGFWKGEIWNRRKNGEVYPQQLTVSSVKDLNGTVVQYTSVFYDITDIKEREDKITHRAYHDPLTELPNRLLFKDRLEQAIARAHRNSSFLSVMFIDIDHFKRLNDSYGHQAGDVCLQQISAKFRGLLRDQDTVSRYAGDEFTILLDSDDPEQGTAVAKKILQLFTEPFFIEGHQIHLGASIGIANYPEDGNTADGLLKNSDTAMYHAKKRGRNCFQIFEAEMATHLKERVTLESELRKALGDDQLTIHYQPIINLHTQKITSIEALLRWDHSGKKGQTAEYISIAEESGLIVPIGEWVLRQTCKRMAEWQIDDVSGLAVSVNLSARQFRDKQLLETIERILDETNINPKQLHIEITEKSVLADMESADVTLAALKKLGIRILLDDFGTGYSSLTCLQRFPVDVLKLDRTFIYNIDKDENSARLAAGIISMAKDLHMEVVAEGVENEAQLAFLEAHNCDMVQGYLFHKPLSEEGLKAVLDKQRLSA